MTLAVGEALVSLLDEKGRPSVTERVFVHLPGSRLGPITPAERTALMQQSLVAGVYDTPVDRESAYEKLQVRAATSADAAAPGNAGGGGLWGSISDVLVGSTGPRGGKHDGLAQTMAKSAVRTIGTSIGRELVRGVLGSLLGRRRR